MSQACNQHRFSIVAILWAGVFAVLLLVLSYLSRERPTAVTGESPLFNKYIPFYARSCCCQYGATADVDHVLRSKKRTPVTFAYGAACNLQVNSGGWIHLPYVRFVCSG